MDVTILTTGQSSSGRKRRQEVCLKFVNFAVTQLCHQVAAGLKALLRKKTKVGSINIDALLKVGRKCLFSIGSLRSEVNRPIHPSHLRTFVALSFLFSWNFATFLQEFKASADLQITRDMYEDALRDLQEEQVVNKSL